MVRAAPRVVGAAWPLRVGWLMEPLMIVTVLVSLLAVGVVVSALALRWRLPEEFFLLLAGVALAWLAARAGWVPAVPSGVVVAVDIAALAVIVFNAAAELCACVFERAVGRAARFVGVLLLLQVPVVAYVAWRVVGLPVGVSVLVAVLLLGSAPGVVLAVVRGWRSPLADVLRAESVLAAPVAVVLPLLVVSGGNKFGAGWSLIGSSVASLAGMLALGAGSGLLVGLLALRLIRRRLPDGYGSLVLLVGALVAYVLAEQVGGSGVLSVAVMGLFFGLLADRERHALISCELVVVRAVHILVFVLLGVVVAVPWSWVFAGQVAVVLGSVYVSRFAALAVSVRRASWLEVLSASVIAPKGLPVVAVALTWSVSGPGSIYAVPSAAAASALVTGVVLVSVLVSSLVGWRVSGGSRLG